MRLIGFRSHSSDRQRPATILGMLAYLLMVSGLSGCAADTLPPWLETFDRTDDYDYHLPQLADARSYPVALSDEGFAWPIAEQTADTAMLELQLIRSQGSTPAIQVEFADRRITQYFEQGGGGRRYLDLSPVLASSIRSGDQVVLRGQGVRWLEAPTRLVTFKNPPVQGRRVLVIAPHPDDAEIAAFGVYKTAIANVTTVTAGDAGAGNYLPLWPEPGDHYRAKGWIRTLDSLMIPLFGGLQPNAVRNLGYSDATLKQLWQDQPAAVEAPLARLDQANFYRQLNFDAELKQRPFTPTWPALVADLLAELQRFRPDWVVVPHPLLDRHPDHQFTGIALFEALAQFDGEPQLLLYTNHGIGNEAFPLGPRDGMTGLPAWNGASLHIRGLYSHPLSAEEQKQKLIALEAMHDLRLFDLRDGTEPLTSPPIFNYFRRGARPNEIFLTTDGRGAQQLRAAFLAGFERAETTANTQ